MRDTSNIICALMNRVLKSLSHTVSTESIFLQRMEMLATIFRRVAHKISDEYSFKT